MVFASTFSRRPDSWEPKLRPVQMSSATEKDAPRESPPKWSTLQEIPVPENRSQLLNAYLLAKSGVTDNPSDRTDADRKRSSDKRYTTKGSSQSEMGVIGLLLNAVA